MTRKKTSNVSGPGKMVHAAYFNHGVLKDAIAFDLVGNPDPLKKIKPDSISHLVTKRLVGFVYLICLAFIFANYLFISFFRNAFRFIVSYFTKKFSLNRKLSSSVHFHSAESLSLKS